MRKILLASLLSFTSLFSDLPTVFPPALQKGDLIALVFPASFLDKENEEAQVELNLKAEWLQLQGYRTIFYPDKVSRSGYLAGTDDERAKALMNAWKNEEVKAIWCFRGGYGSQRILDYLDYDWIKAHPKIFIGMSDITTLHQAIQTKTGLVTFLAPVLKYFHDKEVEFDDSFAFSFLEQVLVNKMTGAIPSSPEGNFEVISPGIAKGKLVGGNLSLIAGLCGTKWQLATDRKILILEDVDEKICSIDRMLWQLKKSGLLDQPAAVILASWTNCTPISKHSFTLEQVFEHYFGNAKYPVIRGFPSGHGKYQITLPLNTEMEINTDLKQVSMLEPSVLAD
jgi:muramoyltetrapeptide carboxypeptidase